MFSPARELLSSLLRPKRGVRRVDDGDFFHSSQPATPSPGPAARAYHESRHATADFTEAEDDEDEEEEDEFDGDADPLSFMPGPNRYRYEGSGHDNNGRRSSTTLQPLFSAGYLGTSPARTDTPGSAC